MVRRALQELKLLTAPESVGAPLSGIDESARQIVERVRPYTMTSDQRLIALIDACRYIARHEIPGDVVECGVWRGGSMMTAALTLQEAGAVRGLHLFDTFEGMTSPSDADVLGWGDRATARELLDADPERQGLIWAVADLAEVEANMRATGYPLEDIHFVRGRVEDTIPDKAPEMIALLRLDTDWYESTKHELVHLFPRVSPGGVLLADDYGFWQGARRAVDEYLEEQGVPLLLHRVDFTGRMTVKPFAAWRND